MLSEWWTYRPHDFLMFSPRIYWRLFESINTAWWPLAALLACTAGGWLISVARHAGGGAARKAGHAPHGSWQVALLWPLALLAVAWAVVALAFLRERYMPIFWAAEVAVWAFLVQAAGWLLMARLGRPDEDRGAVEPEVGGIPAQRRRTGLLLGVVALLPYAALAPLSGRPWLQAELFGLAPDPTVLFSLAVLLLRPLPACASPGARRLARALWVLPVAWCVCSSATLALLGSWQAALPVGAAALCWWACRPRRAAGPR